jgi:hypothetical protein
VRDRRSWIGRSNSTSWLSIGRGLGAEWPIVKKRSIPEDQRQHAAAAGRFLQKLLLQQPGVFNNLPTPLLRPVLPQKAPSRLRSTLSEAQTLRDDHGAALALRAPI